VFNPALYRRAAEDLRRNPGQWAAYNSTGHCILLAGPGSGKTKTLTVKLARMLAEDVSEPRGLACITYNNECARELETRLDALGVEPTRRVFIGTVHSFSLTQIILPYAKAASLGLPEEFRVATQQEQRSCLERAYKRVIGGPGNPQDANFGMGLYRRQILNRDSELWRTRDPETARLVEEYEAELRALGRIDFDDMPLLAVCALRNHPWIQRAIFAKYPILAVDEYQDLGRALHRMVMGLCFSTGIRLFAVGDADQSIYGFVGANPAVLKGLSERDDVETVRLRLNYRCGSRIVVASQYALGEVRDYVAPEGAAMGTVYFHACVGSYEQQARHLFSTILPAALSRMPQLALGRIAVLYPAAWIGNAVAEAAEQYGYGVIRTDGNALYPRSSQLMRWLELCAVWCCSGWQSGAPRFSKLVGDGLRIFAEAVESDESKLQFQRDLVGILWGMRDGTVGLNGWLVAMREGMLDALMAKCRTLDEERATLTAFMKQTGPGGSVEAMSLGLFSGHGEGNDRINLSTLHSAKGREFALVILFAIDEGRLPRTGASQGEQREARRLFYVGFTRAETELHMMYSAHRPSPFVLEVEERLEADA
jgi:superfamily I DNA/RNA helicase